MRTRIGLSDLMVGSFLAKANVPYAEGVRDAVEYIIDNLTEEGNIIIPHNEESDIIKQLPNWRDLYHLRQKLKMSMDDVSEITNVSKSTISRLERGEDVLHSHFKTLYLFYKQNGV